MRLARRRVLAGFTALLTVAALAAAELAGPAPSAIAGTTGLPGNGKAGIASAVYLDRNAAKLLAVGASWAYDWTPQLHPTNLGVRWVPMIWSERYLTPETITELKIAKADRGVRYLLGFNEPDNRHQANMTPAEAAAFWPELESTGLILGSPAPDTPTDGWLQRFMSLAHKQHLRVNFLALHYYMDFTNPDSIAKMRSELIGIHNTYHLPIWITELGALEISRWGQPMMHPPGVVAAQTYMRSVFKMLNALPFVQRYAWYTDRAPQAVCRYSTLFTRTGALTPEGREFRRDS